MKIDYTSDCHLDFWIDEMNPGNKMNRQIEVYCERTGILGGDVLILAGDIGHYFIQDTTFLKYVNSLYEHVLVVSGNHDKYLISNKLREKYKYNSFNRVQEMKTFCEQESIHFLDGNVVTIDSVKIAGTGMSWDLSYLMRNEKSFDEFSDDEQAQWLREGIRLFESNLNDSRLIYEGKPQVIFNNPYHTYEKPKFDAYSYFESEMKKLKQIEHADIIVTHYGPSVPDCLPNAHKNDITTFYYFDGKKEIERIAPKYWIFGHTHDKYKFNVNDTVITSNPIGYPGENLAKKSDKCLSMEYIEL